MFLHSTTFIILSFTVFCFLYFTAKAYRDTWFLAEKHSLIIHDRMAAKKASKYWHAIDAAIHLLVLAFIVFAFVGFNLWLPILTVFAISLRWIIVDASWNLIMKQPFFYTGTSATIDQLTKSVWLQIAAKLFFLLISILFIILLSLKII